MKINFCVLSNTGNNDALVRLFIREIEKLGAYEFCFTNVSRALNAYQRTKELELAPADAYCFATFTDCFRIPPQFRVFLDLLPRQLLENKPLFGLNAHGGDKGVVDYELAEHFSGEKFLGVYSVKFCNSYYSLTYPKNENEIEAIPDTFLPSLYEFVRHCDEMFKHQEEIESSALTCWNKVELKMAVKIPIKLRQRMMTKGALMVLPDKCVGCRICVENCPGNCFDFVDGKAVLARPDSCYTCFNCIQNCPAHAITNQKRTLDNFVEYRFHDYQIGSKKGFHLKKELEAEEKKLQ